MKSDKKKWEDVATLPPEKNLGLTLEEVGLENVQMQVSLQGLLLPARGLATVSLTDKKSRGIHMSRLFRILNDMHEHELSWALLNDSVEQMLSTHSALSDAAHLAVRFDMPVRREALVSGEKGWRNYPVTYRVRMKEGRRELSLETSVLYSSTCPCSTSLSRAAIQDEFRREFPEGQVPADRVMEWLGAHVTRTALPHAQRSEASCVFFFDPEESMPSALALIDATEEALGTAVQTAVKREDEQEFARRNAHNQMFCEDAARKLKAAFVDYKGLADFQIEVRHFESLHPHDVVAKVSKNG